MADSILLFSDAHLGATQLEDDPYRERQVISFLRHAAEKNAAIYIVGDLFEFWFEYRQAIPKHNFAVLASLYELSTAGVEVHYLAGNHDLWLGDFLREVIGVHIHLHSTTVKFGPYHFYITHGDGLAPADRGYRFLKRLLRNKLNIFLYKLIHPDVGIPLAKRMSQVSRNHDNNLPKWQEDYRRFALNKFAEGFNGVVLAHTHFPLHDTINGAHYINLGDWMTHYSYCEISAAGVSLRQWPSMKIYRTPRSAGGSTAPRATSGESAVDATGR